MFFKIDYKNLDFPWDEVKFKFCDDLENFAAHKDSDYYHVHFQD